MSRPQVQPKLNTQNLGYRGPEEAFRLAYIQGSLTLPGLLKEFKISLTRASQIIKSCPECQREKKRRWTQRERERRVKQRRRLAAITEELAERDAEIEALKRRVERLEVLLNVQTNVDDPGPEPE